MYREDCVAKKCVIVFSRVLYQTSSHLIAPFPKVNLDSGGGVDGEPLVRVDRHAEQTAVCVDQLAHISKEERLRRMCPCFAFEKYEYRSCDDP